MRITLQRVKHATCTVDGNITGAIDSGLLLFVGFTSSDTPTLLPIAAKKCVELRIFADEQGKLNRSLTDIGGSILLISQFTLYANCSRGRRPDFTSAAEPKQAEALYYQFISLLAEYGIEVQCGIFGADMQINLVNDGPITINLEW